jgi:hypothetical protein
MSRRVLLTAWNTFGLCIALNSLAVVLLVINRTGPHVNSPWFASSTTVGVVYPLVGAVIALRDPRNARCRKR